MVFLWLAPFGPLGYAAAIYLLRRASFFDHSVHGAQLCVIHITDQFPSPALAQTAIFVLVCYLIHSVFLTP